MLEKPAPTLEARLILMHHCTGEANKAKRVTGLFLFMRIGPVKPPFLIVREVER
jgi:hypothetical protein